MEGWKIGVIVAVAAVVVLVLVIVIVLVKKHGGGGSKAEKTLNDRELISENERSVNALIILARDNAALKDELRKIQEKIKYLIPSEDAKVREYDKKVKEAIEDLRIVLTKADPDDPGKKVDSLLMQLKLAVADRDVKL